MLAYGHSCTLTPSLVIRGLAPMTFDTFSKAEIDSLEVIGSLAMLPLLFLKLVLLSKVKKVSHIVAKKIVREGYSAQLVLDTAKNMYRTLSLQNNWGTAAKPVLALPYRSMGAHDRLITTF